MGDILFLAHRVPYPPDRGDKIRSYHVLKALAALGRVHLVAFADDAADEAHAGALRPLVASLHVERRVRSAVRGGMAALARGRSMSVEMFDSAAMRRHVMALVTGGAIDTIYAFSGQMAQFVPEDRGAIRFVMDFVDMDSAKFVDYAATAAPPMRWVHAREARLLEAFEIATARRADISLFVSEAEAALFRRRGRLGANRVRALGNGVDHGYFDPAATPPLAEAPRPLIVFTGQMDYPPNVAAVSRFATESLPAIRRHVPGVHFAIVGRAPTAPVRALAQREGVIVTGAVDDVRGWLAAADVVVAPLEQARGVQNKVLEAMAMGRPVVASPAAFEGIDALASEHLIVADRDGMAAAVNGLLAAPDQARAMGQAARAWIVRGYDWGHRLRDLPDILGRAPAAVAA